MKIIGLRSFGGPEVLEVFDRPEPHAGPGEIRLRVRAVAAHPADALLRSGAAGGAFRSAVPPYVPGLDAAGVVDEIGPGTATELRIGDAAMAMVNPTRPQGGSYAEFLVLPATSLVATPAGFGFAEAATLPMDGLTARMALDRSDLAPGESIAVTGAAGAVGGFVVQIAKTRGLPVVAEAGPADTDLVRSLGADIVVDRGPGVAGRIRASVPGGVHAVIDAALLGAATLAPAIRDGGVLMHLRGGPDGRLPRGVRADSVFVHDYDGDHAKLDDLRRLSEEGRLTARVAAVHPPEDAAAVHRRLEAGGLRGRLVLGF